MKFLSLTLLIAIFLPLGLLSQFESSNGWRLYPTNDYRALNVFVNIIYDVTPSQDPSSANSPFWGGASQAGVNNEAFPSYLTEFMDVEIGSSFPTGAMSRLYSESSFNKLRVVGDFVVVNINQSDLITTVDAINPYFLIEKVLGLINDNGGVDQTVLYGNDDFNDYDKIGVGSENSNGKFDIVQFIVRNARDSSVEGRMHAGRGFTFPAYDYALEIDGSLKSIDIITIQGVGSGDMTSNFKSVVYHEFSHNLFGGNSFHTTGGNHFGHGSRSEFIGVKGGYGLMGSYGSSLVSCNGYERWRMNWRHGSNSDHRISVQNDNSDISRNDGSKTFYLRDFVTYGDAIRIKLPYRDSPLQKDQYIWLENHQIGSNDKLDFLQYNEGNCFEKGSSGIYAYYQIGKDVVESVDEDEIWPDGGTDNLRPISAEGYWDIKYIGQVRDCPNWTDRDVIEYQEENPFLGGSDLESVFPVGLSTGSLNSKTDSRIAFVKKSGNEYNKSFPNHGDLGDAFKSGSKISLSTNPASTNTLTYNSRQGQGNVQYVDLDLSARKIHLSGLEISFSKDGSNNSGDVIRVDVKWDQYGVDNNVRWAGEIELREEIDLKPNTSISLVQTKTANQHNLNLNTGGLFAPTVMNCLPSSNLIQRSESTITVENGTSLNFLPTSNLTINDGAVLKIKSGGTLNIEDGAVITVFGSGSIDLECGAILCIGNNASVNLLAANSRVLIRGEMDFLSCNEIWDAGIYGDGAVVYLNEDLIIDNVQINQNLLKTGQNIVGSNVLMGNVSDVRVDFLATNSILLNGEFEVREGSIFIAAITNECQN